VTVRHTVVGFAVAALLVGCQRVPPTIVATDAVYVLPAASGPGAIYLNVTNPTNAADTLLGVSSARLAGISLHQTMTMGTGASQMIHMSAVGKLVVPALGRLRLAPGTDHAMADSVIGSPLVVGDTLVLELRLAKGGKIGATARVIRYADLDQR
jgi:copper(I)-binding protein